MSFHFFSRPPVPALTPYVEAVWGVRGSAHYTVESVMPAGTVDLMVNFGPEQSIVAYGDVRADDRFVRAWLAGVQDRHLVHASPEGADHIAVRFRPGGAHAFFDVPMDALRNQVVELDALVGAEASRLRDRLLEAQTDEARSRAMEAWLLERRRVHHSFATVRRALGFLVPGRDGLRVGEVCERLGLSNRYLVQQFRETVGLPPKPVARIRRFQAVIEACRGTEDVSWARTATALGYVDQSHLIREFRKLGGVTPARFLANRTPDEGHVVVG